jgi:anti-sigma regulatory factor (Ser/Thr protein kinase)
MTQAPATPNLSAAVLADHCQMRIPSTPDWIVPTVDYLMARAAQCGAVAASRATKVMLALNEALTNSIIHGNLGVSSKLKEEGDRAFAQAVTARCADPNYAMRPVDIQMNYDGQKVHWVFTDQGEGFDVAAVLRKLDETGPDPFRPSGRGLILMRAFVDELSYDHGGRRARLTLRRSSAEEKRSETRWSLGGLVKVAPIDEWGRVHADAGQDAVARNISAGGIAFLGTDLAPAERVLLTIPLGDQSVQVQAVVRHWQPLGDNVVEVGCRFETALPALTWMEAPASGPLARLVARLAEQQKPHEDRRTAVRVPYTEFVEVALSSGEVIRCFGRDLSRGGIGFLAARDLAHQVVGLRLPGDDQGPFEVRACVVRSTQLVDGFYDVAAQFVSS